MKFLIIDGNSLFHRSYHGVKPLSNKDNIHTHAIFGFLNTYLSIVNKYNPTHIAVAFDTPTPTFRHEISEEYKNNRKGMPDDLVEQFVYLKNILIFMGVKYIECPRFEADDILGTLSKMCNENNIDCNILSGDRDTLQLIGGSTIVTLLKTKNQITYDEKLFFDEYGYKPINIIDFKAISGDKSDNISGIMGVGEKTLTPLIQKYGTVENIYEHLDDLKLTPRYLNLFKNGKDTALFCKKLATINCSAPIDTNIQTYEYKGITDREKLLEVFEYLEMKTFIEKFGLSSNSKDQTVPVKVKKDTPAISTVLIKNNFITKSISTDYAIIDDTLYIIDKNIIYQTSNKDIIKNYLESNVYKRTISFKNHYKFTDNIKNITTDAEISGYLLDTSSKEYTVKSLCEVYGIDYFEELGEFADIYSLPNLNDELSSKVYDLNMNSLEDIELNLSTVLASMEKIGVKVDIETVKNYKEEVDAILKNLEIKIYQQAGKEFKILSPKQLAEILFDELQLPPSKKTKTGYSTDSDVLEKLKEYNPIVQMVIDYRFYHKLKATYIDGLLKTVANDGRIHTIFRQTETRTGRLSSAEPNLQNIPIRNEFSKNIRKFFVADEGKILIDADYNQIELRLTAIMSKDTNMMNSFLSGTDIHTATAMKIFNREANQITSQMRSVAKAVNFGITYGMGAFKLSQDLDIPLKDARQYINNYFEMYPNVKIFMDSTIEECEKTGYVKTILNRIRYIPEIQSKNKILQSSGKRMAMNTPIQGSSADIIKVAMVNVFKRLKNENLDAKLILQVHDELLVESSLECADTVAKIVKEEMENVYKSDIPLTVEVSMGGSWFNAH